jgi:hypothetical protein
LLPPVLPAELLLLLLDLSAESLPLLPLYHDLVI